MAMGGQGQLIMMGFATLLGLSSIGYFVGKTSTKELTQNILATAETCVGMHDIALDYAKISTTGDFQNISIEVLSNKTLLPSGMTVSGTGAGSYGIPSHDNQQKFYVASANGGKKVAITVDASGTAYDADQLQMFEDKIKTSFEKAGATVSNYTSSGADGVITGTFE